MTKRSSIRPLSPDDAPAYVDYFAKNMLTSGVSPAPIFTIFSRHTIVDKASKISSAAKKWGLPLQEWGWERCWAAFDPEGKQIVGEISLSSGRLAETQAHRVVLGMGILPDFRHKGLGKKLMSTALDWASRQTFLEWVDLGVFADNAPARRLYESFHFIETGRTPDCFRVDGHKIDDIQMSLNLREYHR